MLEPPETGRLPAELGLQCGVTVAAAPNRQAGRALGRGQGGLVVAD